MRKQPRPEVCKVSAYVDAAQYNPLRAARSQCGFRLISNFVRPTHRPSRELLLRLADNPFDDGLSTQRHEGKKNSSLALNSSIDTASVRL